MAGGEVGRADQAAAHADVMRAAFGITGCWMPRSGMRGRQRRQQQGWKSTGLNLARISHQLTAADTDLTVFAALNAAGGLDVLSSTPARPDSRSPCKFSHLRALARNLVRNAG